MCTRHQAGDPVLTLFVRRGQRSVRSELALVLPPHRSDGRHPDPGDRLAELIRDLPRDDAHSRQRHVDVLEHLPCAQVQQPALFERAALAVPQREKATALRRQRKPACGKFREFVTALVIRARRETSRRQTGASQGESDTSQRTVVLGIDDTTADRGGAGSSGGRRRIAWSNDLWIGSLSVAQSPGRRSPRG